MTANVTRSVMVTQPAAGASAARGGGRGPYLGGVGKPGEGVPDELMQGGMNGPGGPARGGFGFGGPPPGAPAPAGPGGARGPANPFAGMLGGGRGGPQTAYAIAADGVLHTLGVMEGKDLKKPISFLPPNANVPDTIAIGERLYAATSNGCAGVPNGVWAIDLSAADPKPISWKSPGSPTGMVFGSKGPSSSRPGMQS
jgi:hypothetical protein